MTAQRPRTALDYAIAYSEAKHRDDPQPAEQRHTVDTINSDQLDALYDRLTKAEQDAKDSIAAAAHLTTLVGKRSERAERAAKGQRRRAESAETELFTLRCGIRALGGDPTAIQNLWAQIRLRNRQWREEKQRAERAEAAIARVRAIADRWDLDGPPPGNRPLTELRAALDEPKEPRS